jgi:hypothetical protein
MSCRREQSGDSVLEDLRPSVSNGTPLELMQHQRGREQQVWACQRMPTASQAFATAGVRPHEASSVPNLAVETDLAGYS